MTFVVVRKFVNESIHGGVACQVVLDEYVGYKCRLADHIRALLQTL
jgi:hypothetical protein